MTKKKLFLLNERNLTNVNVQKLKKTQKELTHAKKEQLKYIQGLINKIRNLVENEQSQSTWSTVNEASRKKRTLRAKLRLHPPKKGGPRITKNYRGLTLTTKAAKIYNALPINHIWPEIKTQRRDGANATSIWSPERNSYYHNDAVQKHKSNDSLNWWWYRLFQHHDWSLAKRYISAIYVYNLPRLHTLNINRSNKRK